MSFDMSSTIDLSDRNLVSTQWLKEHLDVPNLRVVDASIIVNVETWDTESGREPYEKEHIPGAVFLDHIDDLSDLKASEVKDQKTRAYQLPSAKTFEHALGNVGISNDSAVVIYETQGAMWAARLWWMFRVYGHENVAVLDGGLKKWTADGYPTTSTPPQPEKTTFNASFREALFAAKDEVFNIATNGATGQLIDALSEKSYRGVGDNPLPRKGHIPTATNVPYMDVLNEDNTFKSKEELAKLFEESLKDNPERVITYCGGGIAATSAALALTQLGVDAAVYNGSLSEWIQDENAPLIAEG